MSNKSLLFVLLFIAAIISIDGCKSKKSDEVNPNDSLSVDSTLKSPCVVLSEKINNLLYRQYEYDSLSRLTRLSEYSGSTTNRVLRRVTFQYNAAGRLSQFNETNLAERDKSYIYNVDYDANNNVTALRKFKVYNSGPRNVDSLTVVYDELKRIIELKSAAESSSYKWQYDSLGNAKNWLVRTPAMTQDSVLAQYTSYDKNTNLYAFSKGIQLVNLLMGRAPSRRNLLNYNIGKVMYQATYQYNNQKVPTQSVLKTMTVNGTDTTKIETVFSYDLRCK